MSNLVQNRFGVWYARLVVPEALRPFLGKRELKRTLSTKDHAEAKRRALPVLDEFHSELEAARLDQVVQPADLTRVTELWFNSTLSRMHEPDVKACFQQRFRDGEGEAAGDYFYSMIDSLTTILEELEPARHPTERTRQQLHRWMEPFMQEALSLSNLKLSTGSPNYHALACLLAKKFIRLSNMVTMNSGVNVVQQRIGQPEIPLVTSEPGQDPRPLTGGMVLSALFERYRITVTRQEPKRAVGRLLEYGVAVERYIELLGDHPIRQIRKQDIADFRSLLEQLPARPKRNVSCLPLRQQIAMTEREALPRLSAGTVKKLGRGLSAILGFAVDEGLLEQNPAHGIKYAEAVTNPLEETLRPFLPAELATIFGSPNFASRQPHARFGAATYWVPLILYYTGARLEEICQLYVADLLEQDGIWFIRIAPLREDQTVKNRSSIRDVPIHSHLLALGLLTYARSLPAGGRLFPQLTASGKRQKYHVRIGVWWQRFLREKLKLEREDIKPFHSLRHTMITYMRAKDVREDIQNAIVGHSQNAKGTATGRAYGSYPMAVKQEVLECLPRVCLPGDNIRGPQPPWVTPESLSLTHQAD